MTTMVLRWSSAQAMSGAVAVGGRVEPGVEAVELPRDEMTLAGAGDVGVVPARGEHRVQGEGDEQRDRHGEGHRDAEVAEEPPDDALHEGHRDEHRDDRHGGGQHREADLGGAVARRGVVVLAALEVPDDVLAHHDRVVDQQADRQRQRHQGHGVERHAREVHDDERGDDRDGQREAGDHGRAPRVQEAEHDQDGQQRADHQGLLDVAHRLADRDRSVPDDLDAGALGQARAAAPRLPRAPRRPRPRCWRRSA